MIPKNICVICQHYKGNDKCSPYPDGIPKKILLGIHDHRKPFPGDNGIRFKSIVGKG